MGTEKITDKGFNIFDFLSEYGAEKDNRVHEWPLMSSFNNCIFLSVIYMIIVKYAGPKWMENRKPFNLKNVITMYNIFQITSCAMIIYNLSTTGKFSYPIICQSITQDVDIKVMNVYWWTMLLKLSEFIETVFFVLRKKQSQVSGLHVYHHVSTFMLMWTGCRYKTGEIAKFYIINNSFIHIIMYTYYLLTAVGSKGLLQFLNKYKKYITILQMVQFWIFILHACQAFMGTCDIPRILVFIFIPNVVLVYLLFKDFYTSAYKKNK
jgi:uncharacterized membrane protein YidH (DUF202 family)